MQRGLNRRVNRPVTTLASRLKSARKRRGLSQERLAELAQMKQSDISKLENGRMHRSTGIARLAAVLEVPALWLELEDGPAPTFLESPNGEEGAIAAVGNVIALGGGRADSPPPRSRGAVYQGVSQPSLMISPPLLEWTDLMSGDLPSLFKLTVLDDAMTPEFKPGSVVIFTAGLPPKPRDAVLVRDPLGNHYFREYRVGLVGQWYAAAIHAGFDPLYPDQHGIEVVAVMTGRDGRRSD